MSERSIDRRLLRLIEANGRLRDPVREPRNRLPTLLALQRWQAARLRDSFVDFLASDRERAAAEFFLSDLYGDFDVSGRDRDVERVLPVMRRVLPAKLLVSAADAIELQVLSHAFDLRMAERLAEDGKRKLTVARYADAYRAVDRHRLRAHQVDLIVRIGLSLDRAVSIPMIGQLLWISRGPARAAGLAQLQSFLERGFEAFKRLDGAAAFVNEIARRELKVCRRLLDGDPDPFRPA